MKTSSALVNNHYSQDESSQNLATSPPQLDIAAPPQSNEAKSASALMKASDFKGVGPEDMMIVAWEQAMDLLQNELSAPAYSNYLRHIQPIELLEDRLVLSAPSDFVKDWLIRRFGQRIEAALHQFFEKPMALAFKIVAVEFTAEDNGNGASMPVARPTAPVAPSPRVGMQQPETQQRIELPKNDQRQAAQPPQAPRARAVRDVNDLEDFSSSPLNRKYTFDDFIVGRSNYIAHAASWAVAHSPAKGQYNPLFVYGGVGLGKTHLMQAIGHYASAQSAKPMEVVYVSGENFLYQVVRCIREDRMTAFRRMYRNVDIWLVDDIQYICNAERTEVEFFHIFNTLYDQGKQIVICSDKQPKELNLTESRLISRFEWGLITCIEPPDLEHRIAILQKRAQAEGVHVDAEVLQYLAEKIRSNIRSLEGALTRLLAMASLDKRKINIDLASETVRYYSTAEAEPIKVEVDTIIQVVSDHYKLAISDILGKKRNKEIVTPRQVAMYLAREMAQMSYPDIGRAFGRDYTTVIHSYEKIKSEIKKDSTLKNSISEIRSKAHAKG